jgi:ZIP family zinc transporter
MTFQIILQAGFSGITVFVGAILAYVFEHHVEESRVKSTITHFTVAFGGGILLSAVALVLVPHGLEELSLTGMILSFVAGAVIFSIIDKRLEKRGGRGSQLLAMLMDFIPESIALGAVFARDMATGTLLAIFIGLQNLPEAFNSFRDVILSGFKVKTAFVIFFLLSFCGIAGALLGHHYLRDSPDVTAHLMVFASGGILYLIFQDIAPESKLQQSWMPALGAALGFLVGMVGEKLI